MLFLVIVYGQKKFQHREIYNMRGEIEFKEEDER